VRLGGNNSSAGSAMTTTGVSLGLAHDRNRGSLGGSVVATVEADGGDLDLTAGLGRVLDRPVNLNIGSTTALGVGDLVSTLLAAGGLLASGAAGHLVVELKTAVKLDINVEVADSELVNTRVGATAE
jgi:hypothetical protein